jgi:hypothetical protein
VRASPRAAFREMVLERLPVVATQRLASSLVEGAVLQCDSDFAAAAADNLLLRLQAYVWAEHLASGDAVAVKLVDFDEPTSPWQMLKRDSLLFRSRLGAAFLRRFPVRVKVVSKRVVLTATWRQYRAFPDADLPVPPERLGRPVRLDILSIDCGASDAL